MEKTSYPIFRHNARDAEMVTGELAGQYEAPLYGMIAVQKAIDKMDWIGLEKPTIRLHGQPSLRRNAGQNRGERTSMAIANPHHRTSVAALTET